MDAHCAETTTFNGCNVKRLTNNREFDGFPSWSPDGKWIAFSSKRDGNFEIYRLDTSCLAQPEPCLPQRLTTTSANDLTPIWSPDGRQIAFVSGPDVMVMDADGSRLQRLAQAAVRDQFLAWRPLP